MIEYDLLCIGHCCHDIHENGTILGGTTSYASQVAKALGYNSVVFSSVGRDFRFFDAFKRNGIPFYYTLGEETTKFENVYTSNGRTQYLLSRAKDIKVEDIPKAYKKVPMVLIGPIADEVDFGCIEYFQQSLVGVTIQGFLRRWNEEGRVYPKVLEWSRLKGVDIAFLSDEDITGMEEALDSIKAYCRMVVVTHGGRGTTVYFEDKAYFKPSFPVHEVDATGAGDVFATAYLLSFNKTRDIYSSLVYAHCAASFIIEGIGISSLPDEAEILMRVEEYHNMFDNNKTHSS